MRLPCRCLAAPPLHAPSAQLCCTCRQASGQAGMLVPIEQGWMDTPSRRPLCEGTSSQQRAQLAPVGLEMSSYLFLRRKHSFIGTLPPRQLASFHCIACSSSRVKGSAGNSNKQHVAALGWQQSCHWSMPLRVRREAQAGPTCRGPRGRWAATVMQVIHQHQAAPAADRRHAVHTACMRGGSTLKTSVPAVRSRHRYCQQVPKRAASRPGHSELCPTREEGSKAAGVAVPLSQVG